MAPKRKAAAKEAEEEAAAAAPAPAAKRAHRAGGVALTWGQNCMGQLGVDLDISERKKPTPLAPLESHTIVEVAAGGMHCAVVTAEGTVYTWGCNDQNALGRVAADEESAEPGLAIGLEGVHVVAVSAGDSHTAALTNDGRVFATGCFRDSNGIMGFTELVEEQVGFAQVYPPLALPAALAEPAYPPATAIASGVDHIAILTASKDPQRQLWTLGCPGQGQLGRVSERHTERDAFRDRGATPEALLKRRATLAAMLRFLRPHPVAARCFTAPLASVHCGGWSTVVVDRDGRVFGTGLNNYGQLGHDSGAVTALYAMVPCELWADRGVAQLSCGGHHTLALCRDGGVLAIGRGSEGQLGVPRASFVDGKEEAAKPVAVPALAGQDVAAVNASASMSYAVLRNGSALAWGFGENLQLGTGEEDDQYEPVPLTGKQLEGKDVLAIAAGGQHSILLAAPTHHHHHHHTAQH